MNTATLKFDFDTRCWVAVHDENERLIGHGDTPQEAVDALAYQGNKHGLWPDRKGKD